MKQSLRIVVALGGNALLKRGEKLTAENQRENVKTAAQALSRIADNNELIITHGNGPQVGLLALQNVFHDHEHPYPLDVLDAETEGGIGYMIEQELGNLLPPERPFATILTMVEVNRNDPAFQNPTKPIGPQYTKGEADELRKKYGWHFSADGQSLRRVVPSPLPKRIFEIRPIKWLLEKNTVVICTGGGGIPTLFQEDGKLYGTEAVIDKDRTSALLADELDADLLIFATDVDGVYKNWGTDCAEKINHLFHKDINRLHFHAGSMGPKVEASLWFTRKPDRVSMIGALADLKAMVERNAGTCISHSND